MKALVGGVTTGRGEVMLSGLAASQFHGSLLRPIPVSLETKAGGYHTCRVNHVSNNMTFYSGCIK